MAETLHRPLDGASAAAFRFLFGLVMFGALLRFVSTGQIEALFLEPTFFFKYPGLSWVAPLPSATLMYAHCAVLMILALCVAFGAFYRAAIVLFGAGFLWLELIDVTNYLNHYYLVVLLCAVMSVMPLGLLYSVDAWRSPSQARFTVPAWVVYLLRFQLAVVYVHAGLAKFGVDWLLHAQPLGIWFAARTETPLIGGLLSQPLSAYVASWAGFLFDLTVVLWLSLRPTRPFAFVGLVAFHLVTGVLFDIGIFPIVMTTSALIFFAPSWPRAIVKSRAPVGPAPSSRMGRPLTVLLVCFCAAQLLLPLRHLLHPGDVIWNEEGMRFSWKVMLRSKNGSVSFRVRDVVTGREFYENPKRYLTHRQLSEMSSQPDLILQMARHIGTIASRQLGHPVEVRADALASLNGRRAAPLIDPTVDLMQVSAGFSGASWIAPPPTDLPLDVFGAQTRQQAQAAR